MFNLNAITSLLGFAKPQQEVPPPYEYEKIYTVETPIRPGDVIYTADDCRWLVVEVGYLNLTPFYIAQTTNPVLVGGVLYHMPTSAIEIVYDDEIVDCEMAS